MAKKVKLGSTKRYGVRYGRRNKEKVASLEKEHRGRHKCPYCNYVKVIRLAKGIWHCTKCEARFAGKAYTYEIPKKPSIAGPSKKKGRRRAEEETMEEDEDLLEQEEPEATEASEETAEPEAPLETEEPAVPEEENAKLSEDAEVA
jgi:large subunit ribosomal protein L37Ae